MSWIAFQGPVDLLNGKDFLGSSAVSYEFTMQGFEVFELVVVELDEVGLEGFLAHLQFSRFDA